ncbi:MAG: response regulator [Longimicrobiaceae bacterium]
MALETAALPATRRRPPSPRTAETGTIFVADDNPAILDGVRRALSARGHEVRTAASGSELLELFLASPRPPDLLLLDVVMPGRNGLEVLAELQRDERYADLPVMFITATREPSLPVAALRGGAVDFLPKPFRLGELMARVELHLRKSRELKRARASAKVRLQILDTVRELDQLPNAGAIFDLVTARAARALGVRRCSVVLAEEGDGFGRVAASSDGRSVSGLILDLDRYPEIRAALRRWRPVHVPNVHDSTIFASLLREWQKVGFTPPLKSVVVVPFRLGTETKGVFVIRAQEDEEGFGEEAAEFAEMVAEGMVRVLEERG